MGDETRMQVRELKKGVEAVGGIAERYMIRWLGPLGRKISGLPSKNARLMALLGVVAVVVSLILIVTDATWFRSFTRKGHSYVTITYEMKGYGIAFVAGVALIIAGIMQKKR